MRETSHWERWGGDNDERARRLQQPDSKAGGPPFFFFTRRLQFDWESRTQMTVQGTKLTDEYE
jgi:hypothetical protein